MRLTDLKIYTQTYNGDTRKFFTINDRYSGYISRDGALYFVLDKDTNSYKDYSANELDQFLQSLNSSGIQQTFNDVIKAPGNFMSNITTGDTGKIGAGVLLLGALAIGIILINKR